MLKLLSTIIGFALGSLPGFAKNSTCSSNLIVQINQPSASEALSYYESHLDDFRYEEQVNLSVFFVARNLAEKDVELSARTKLAASRVEAWKETTTNRATRNLGWVSRGDIQAWATKMVFSLSQGELSEPVVKAEGCYVFRVHLKKQSGIATFEESRAKIELLLKKKMKQNNDTVKLPGDFF